ncbi:hypothetical protein D3C84_673280 [compost metagenome]
MNRSSPNLSSTPASMAAARGAGMWRISLSNQPLMPHRVISKEEMMKAPMASARLKLPRLVMSRAAPGVDQAVSTGVR